MDDTCPTFLGNTLGSVHIGCKSGSVKLEAYVTRKEK